MALTKPTTSISQINTLRLQSEEGPCSNPQTKDYDDNQTLTLERSLCAEHGPKVPLETQILSSSSIYTGKLRHRVSARRPGLRASKGQRNFRDHFTKGETEAHRGCKGSGPNLPWRGVGEVLQGGSPQEGAQNARPLQICPLPAVGNYDVTCGEWGLRPEALGIPFGNPGVGTAGGTHLRRHSFGAHTSGLGNEARSASPAQTPRPSTSATRDSSQATAACGPLNITGRKGARGQLHAHVRPELSLKAGGAVSQPIGSLLPAWPRLIRQASGVPLSPGQPSARQPREAQKLLDGDGRLLK